MTIHQLATIHDDLGNAIQQISPEHPVLLKCDGTSLGALVSMEDLRLLERYIDEIEERIDLEEARKALDEVDRDGAIPFEVVRQEFGL